MKIRDGKQADWDKCVEVNTDAYGAQIVRYAELWAYLMEEKLEAGEELSAIAKSTSNEANATGITVLMHGAAVVILAELWKHGEALRRWHNLETQIGTEGEKVNESGGTLNPAILSLSRKGFEV